MIITRPDGTSFKKCGHCKDEKDPGEFYRSTSAADGLQGCCKICARKRAYYPKGDQKPTQEARDEAVARRSALNASAKQPALDGPITVKEMMSKNVISLVPLIVADQVRGRVAEFPKHTPPAERPKIHPALGSIEGLEKIAEAVKDANNPAPVIDPIGHRPYRDDTWWDDSPIDGGSIEPPNNSMALPEQLPIEDSSQPSQPSQPLKASSLLVGEEEASERSGASNEEVPVKPELEPAEGDGALPDLTSLGNDSELPILPTFNPQNITTSRVIKGPEEDERIDPETGLPFS